MLDPETLLQKTFDSLDDAVFVLDPQTRRVLSCNAAVERIFGYAPAEVIGRETLLMHVDRTHYEQFGIQAREVLAAEGVYRCCYRLRRRDGSLFPSEHTHTAIKDAAGRPLAVVAVVRDLSAWRQVRQRLEEAEDRFRILFEQATTGLVTIGADGRFLQANPAFCRFVGYSEAELRRLSVLDVSLSADRERTAAWLAGGSDRQAVDLEKGYRHKSGITVWGRTTTTCVRGEGEQPGFCLAMVQDITDRRQAEEALRESERRFHEMLENIQLAAVIIDLGGKIVYCNDFLLRFTGFGRREVLGRDWFALFIPPEEQQKLRRAWSELVATGEKPLYFENEILTRSGERRLLAWNNTLLYDAAGQPVASASIGEDVTERRRVEMALRENERLKNEFISTAAHQLNTPLTAIMGYAELLSQPQEFGTFSAEQTREFLQEIHARGEELAAIVSDLLDLGRTEAGRPLSLVKGPCRIGEILRQAMEECRQEHPGRRLELHLGAPGPGALLLDRRRILQVLGKLLSNAVKYSPPEGRIRVRGALRGEWYRVSVTDQGIGMTREQLARVFDTFYRVDASDTAVHGFGLGLGIARSIIEAHGGRIRVRSAPGRGTSVSFTLPATSRRDPGERA